MNNPLSPVVRILSGQANQEKVEQRTEREHENQEFESMKTAPSFRLYLDSQYRYTLAGEDTVDLLDELSSGTISPDSLSPNSRREMVEEFGHYKEALQALSEAKKIFLQEIRSSFEFDAQSVPNFNLFETALTGLEIELFQLPRVEVLALIKRLSELKIVNDQLNQKEKEVKSLLPGRATILENISSLEHLATPQASRMLPELYQVLFSGGSQPKIDQKSTAILKKLGGQPHELNRALQNEKSKLRTLEEMEDFRTKSQSQINQIRSELASSLPPFATFFNLVKDRYTSILIGVSQPDPAYGNIRLIDLQDLSKRTSFTEKAYSLENEGKNTDYYDSSIAPARYSFNELNESVKEGVKKQIEDYYAASLPPPSLSPLIRSLTDRFKAKPDFLASPAIQIIEEVINELIIAHSSTPPSPMENYLRMLQANMFKVAQEYHKDTISSVVINAFRAQHSVNSLNPEAEEARILSRITRVLYSQSNVLGVPPTTLDRTVTEFIDPHNQTLTPAQKIVLRRADNTYKHIETIQPAIQAELGTIISTSPPDQRQEIFVRACEQRINTARNPGHERIALPILFEILVGLPNLSRAEQTLIKRTADYFKLNRALNWTVNHTKSNGPTSSLDRKIQLENYIGACDVITNTSLFREEILENNFNLMQYSTVAPTGEHLALLNDAQAFYHLREQIQNIVIQDTTTNHTQVFITTCRAATAGNLNQKQTLLTVLPLLIKDERLGPTRRRIIREAYNQIKKW